MASNYRIVAYYTGRGKIKKITENTTLTMVESESTREVIECHSWEGAYETVPMPTFIIAEIDKNEDVRLFAFENHYWDEEAGPCKRIHVNDLNKLNIELKNHQGECFEDTLAAAQPQVSTTFAPQ